MYRSRQCSKLLGEFFDSSVEIFWGKRKRNMKNFLPSSTRDTLKRKFKTFVRDCLNEYGIENLKNFDMIDF